MEVCRGALEVACSPIWLHFEHDDEIQGRRRGDSIKHREEQRALRPDTNASLKRLLFWLALVAEICREEEMQRKRRRR
jgi:hypothetical protein